VGASTSSQIDDVVVPLAITLTDDEARLLETPYTPRHDFQSLADDRELQRIMARIPGLPQLAA